MRGSGSVTSCLAALAFVGLLRVTSAALIESSATVTASANGWDTRTEGFGCSPGGCVASNSVDDSLEDNSRWSCNSVFSGIDGCELTLALSEPQDIEEIRLALWKGDQRIRTMNIWVDGSLVDSIESSGTTQGFEAFQLTAPGASTIVLQATGMADNGWLSILGVKFMVDDGVVVSAPSPAPVSAPSPAPVSVPSPAPVSPPSPAPVSPPTSAPVSLVTPAPVPLATPAPVSLATPAPVSPPTPAPVSPPTPAPVSPPTPAPVFLVTPAPVSPPTSAPVPLATPAPVSPPTLPPVSPPTSSPVPLATPAPVSPPTPAPLSDNFVGCFNDLVTDPVMTSVVVDDALTEEACAAICEASGDAYYALKQGNECWCAGCDLTEFSTNTDYDRHGDGTCDTPCAGDASATCGGDGSFSLFYTGGCSDALVDLDVPDDIAAQIFADATGGFAGPGFYELDDGLLSRGPDGFQFISESDGTLTITGTFQREDGSALPESIAVFLYLDDDDESTDISLGQGEIDPSTGEFSINLTDIALGVSRVIVSFVVIDPADALADQGKDTVFLFDVANNGCNTPMTITLTWSTENTDLDLFVTEPGGTIVSFTDRWGDVGFIDIDNRTGLGPENFMVYSGLNIEDDAVLGDYIARVSLFFTEMDTTWTLTARIHDEVIWVEEGSFEALSANFGGEAVSDPYTVTVDSYGPEEC